MNKLAFADAVASLLKADRDVQCAFGRITTRVYAAYTGRNPMTGGDVPVPPGQRDPAASFVSVRCDLS